ncbi:universal stress protein [Sabulilitoribacter arenilitoris]|uniref:Universal stress protein n=1 Tax=Wocania arenilitoris TaxID=2044858 RepID=A0AAE3EM01_9FLAO|nr:universal stress protein [Wocania arenilitoris]MCF7567342.1 universal stress protein [Wocania arenilitoris]
MKNIKYKILLLSDLKNNPDTIIKTTANLAKAIGGNIDLLHVKKPVDIVESDNQLSSMRTISRDYLKSKGHIDSIIKSVDSAINISYGLTYGNVKREIEEHINKTNPDIIVLGKKKFSTLKVGGDKLTNFIIKTYKGIVLITSNDYVLGYNENLSLGVFNGFEQSSIEDISKKLVSLTKKPIKSFKIEKAEAALAKQKDNLTPKNTVEYIFEPNDQAVNNISSYMLKNKIDLLCINRDKINSKGIKTDFGNIDLNNIMKKVNVSLLLTG